MTAARPDYSRTAQEIIPGLWFGPLYVVQDKSRMEAIGLTHVLTVLDKVEYAKVEGINYVHFQAADAKADIAKHFDGAHQYIDAALKGEAKTESKAESGAGAASGESKSDSKEDGGKAKKHNVLVHCSSGISRSGAIVLTFVMREKKLSLMDAWRLVSAKRPVVLPNDHFFQQLLEFEKAQGLSKEPSMTKDQYKCWALVSMTAGFAKPFTFESACAAYKQAGNNADVAFAMALD